MDRFFGSNPKLLSLTYCKCVSENLQISIFYFFIVSLCLIKFYKIRNIQAIAETKIKNSEVPSVTQLCVAICCRYASFSELLLAEMKKNLPQKKSDKIANPAKLKIDLRFFFLVFILFKNFF